MTQNPFLDQLKLETVSYNRRIQYLQKEYQTGVANRESLDNYNLTEQDVNCVATFYTHPAVATVTVYPNDTDDWWEI